MPLPPSNHPGGNIVLFGDGSVRTISKNVLPAQVHAAATRNGGEPVSCRNGAGGGRAHQPEA